MGFLAGQRVTGTALNLAISPPMFSGYLVAAQSIPNNAFTPINIDTETIDTHNGHSNTTNNSRYVCQVAGVYELTGSVVLPASGTGTRGAAFGINGLSAPITGSEQLIAPSPGFATTIAPTPSLIRLAVGDYVTLLGFQNSGAAVNTASVGAAMNTFNVQRISD